MDYKEYSRLRAIASKRLKRAAAAGYSVDTHVPTVKEVRASKNPADYMKAVKKFLDDNDSKLAVVRKSGGSYAQIEVQPSRPKKPLTDAQRARRREQNRRSKAKRAVERTATSEADAKKRAGYLKALETVSEKWKEAGIDIGNWLGVLSPKKAQAFADYMEYRFSQGDYKNRYTVDTFIRDFGELVKRNYNFDDIKGDFDNFLDKQKQLSKNRRRTNQYGITEDEVDSAWRKFVKGDS